MKTFFSILSVLLSSFLIGQNFVITPMYNPDPDLRDLWCVSVIGNKAFASSTIPSSYSLYFNGQDWVEGTAFAYQSSGFKQTNGDIFALALNANNLLMWNNSINNWQNIAVLPSGFHKMDVYSENKTYTICSYFSSGEYYGKIFSYNGTVFTEHTSDYDYSYSDLWVKDENNVLIISNKSTHYPPKLFRFNGVSLAELYVFNDNYEEAPTAIWSHDGNTFFILNECGDVYQWNDTHCTMQKVFTGSCDGKNNRDIFAIDSNNVIVCGGYWMVGGTEISHINIGSGQKTTLYQGVGRIKASDYGDGRAIFVGDNGAIFQMLVENSISKEELANSLNIYPSPADDVINIEFPVFGIDIKTIEIFDTSGKLVSRDQFSSFQGSLDVSGLTTGVYILRLFNEKGEQISAKKFMKK